MATTAILRSLSRVSSRCVLLQMQPLSRCTNNNVLVSKQFTASPALAAMFEAKRGPFTPEEKRGTGHMMDASTHWKLERSVAIALCGLMPAALFVQGAAMDHLLSTVIYLHGFWGMNVVIEDYVDKFVPWFKKVWYLIAIIGFAGLVNFNYNDVGLCQAVKMLWSL